MEMYTAIAAAFCYSSSSTSSSSSSSSSSSWTGKRRKSFSRWRYGRSCLCSDKRSVDVGAKITDSNLQKQKPAVGSTATATTVNLNKECLVDENSDKSVSVADTKKTKLISLSEKEKEKDAFTFQTSNFSSPELETHCSSGIVTSGSFSFPVLKTLPTQYELPLKSLDVFHPSENTSTTSATSTPSCWRLPTTPDTSRRSFAFLGSPSFPNRILEDDIASDTSSDLFEIESFSTNMTSGNSYRRDSLDEILLKDPQRLIDNTAEILNLRRVLEEEPARPSSNTPR